MVIIMKPGTKQEDIQALADKFRGMGLDVGITNGIGCSILGLVGDTIAFSPQDFAVESGTDAVLSHITLASLPDPGAGSLTMGGQALTVGTVVDATALSGRGRPAPRREWRWAPSTPCA